MCSHWMHVYLNLQVICYKCGSAFYIIVVFWLIKGKINCVVLLINSLVQQVSIIQTHTHMYIYISICSAL